MSKEKIINELKSNNALVAVHGGNISFLGSTSKAEMNKANRLFDDFVKAKIAHGKTYIRVIKAEYQIKKSGAYMLVLKDDGKPYKKNEWALFAKEKLGLEISQANDDVKIYQRFFDIVDENGNPSNEPFYIGNNTASDYSKTALIALSTLDDNQLSEAVAQGLKPDMTVAETKKIVKAVKPSKAGNDKPKKHPCESMDFTEFTKHVIDSFLGFSKSEAWRVYACKNTSLYVKDMFLDKLNSFTDDIIAIYDKWEEENATEETEEE